MFAADFRPHRLLPALFGSTPFSDYCKQRGIALGQGGPIRSEDFHGWKEAVSRLTAEEQARVELELAQVDELSDPDATGHLLDAAAGGELPPDTVPHGAALALWFLLLRPDLFREVFLHHEVRELDSWRAARAAPGLPIPNLSGRAASLAASVGEFFRLSGGTGQFCAADAHRIGADYCFVVRVSDRLRLFDGFTDRGVAHTQHVRPAVPVLFLYRPDGTVLLQSRLRARDRIADLFSRFGEAALDAPVEYGGAAFDLDVLKGPFNPLPDADDMESVRVKALHLRYPDRFGRRQVKLETSTADEPAAVELLLGRHAGDETTLSQLRVCHAELQVRMRVNGRSKSYSIRLWPDRCDLDQTPHGERLRNCLSRWGLRHADQC